MIMTGFLLFWFVSLVQLYFGVFFSDSGIVAVQGTLKFSYIQVPTVQAIECSMIKEFGLLVLFCLLLLIHMQESVLGINAEF